MSKVVVLVALVAGVRDVAADAATGLPVYIEDTPKPDPRDDGSERYVTAGVLSAPTGGWFGIRAQIDLISYRRVSLGVAGTLFGRGDGSVPVVPALKASGVGFLAYTVPVVRNIAVRGQLGFGGALTLAEDDTTMSTARDQIVEGSLLVTGRANHDWSILGGPILQRAVETEESTWMLLVGVQRRYK